ncbi:MAG: hypothetical protein WCQ72_07805 [Eubacteriales bacterium]
MKNRKLKSALALLICSMITACGAAETAQTSILTAEQTSAAAEETTAIGGVPALPDNDLGGAEITFLLRTTPDDWSADDVIAEVEDGSTINDAVYRRNSYIEDTYNVKIKGINAPVDHSVFTPVSNAILSGSSEFDIITSRATDSSVFMQSGYILELGRLPYIELDAAWWNPTYTNSMMIGSRCFYATGDISRVDNLGVRCFFFNKDIAADLSLEDPYALVRSGDWTYDKLFSLASAASADLDGSAVMDDNDRYGIQAQSSLGMVLAYAGGMTVTGFDSDNLPIITADSKYSIEVLDAVKNGMEANVDNIFYSNNWLKTQTRFTQGQALFQAEVMLLIEALRASEVNIGILPAPKYSSAQDNYIGFLDAHCLNLYSVPITCKQTDNAAFVLEAMARGSVDTLTPAFYDICLNGKYIRDNDSSEMLDIIFSSYISDNICSFGWGGIYDAVAVALSNGKDIASVVEKYRSKTELAIGETVEALNSIN